VSDTEPERTPAAMSRAEALEVAMEHVTKAATNSRGFMDGASFAERMIAAHRFARFLLGEDN
jgi:hypothetical protein